MHTISSDAPHLEQHPNDPPRSCGAVVIRPREDFFEVLLIRSKRGNWSFPKGRMDPGESETATAIREIREETGIIVSIDVRFRREVPAIPVDRPGFQNDRLVVFYLAKAIGGEDQPRLSEIRELKWVPFCEGSAALIDFPPDREVFLDAIDAFSDLG